MRTISRAPFEMTEGPYIDESSNLIYELLFCDRPELFRNAIEDKGVEPWATLLRDDPDLEAVRKIADDPEQESRVRMLAYNLLRRNKHDGPPRILLGTIFEVSMPEGHDTLAVFADGGVRYINYTGKISVVEGKADLLRKDIDEVLAASQAVVNAIGPWEKERLPAPRLGNVRMTFLVSDGLYFGEGPMQAMQQDRLSAPVVNSATKLFLKVVDLSVDGNTG